MSAGKNRQGFLLQVTAFFAEVWIWFTAHRPRFVTIEPLILHKYGQNSFKKIFLAQNLCRDNGWFELPWPNYWLCWQYYYLFMAVHQVQTWQFKMAPWSFTFPSLFTLRFTHPPPPRPPSPPSNETNVHSNLSNVDFSKQQTIIFEANKLSSCYLL